jgi:alpha/beta superfamily hydrolase
VVIYRGVPEAEDYQAVVKHYLGRCKSTQESLFCGYSAGSLSASFCKPVPGVKTRYLLISYPLSVLWALTLFKSSPFTSALEGILCAEDTPLLSIRGDKDQFTGDSKYTSWEARLGALSKTATFVTVAGADHFWSGKQHLQTLLGKVSEWLNEGNSTQGTSPL